MMFQILDRCMVCLQNNYASYGGFYSLAKISKCTAFNRFEPARHFDPYRLNLSISSFSFFLLYSNVKSHSESKHWKP